MLEFTSLKVHEHLGWSCFGVLQECWGNLSCCQNHDERPLQEVDLRPVRLGIQWLESIELRLILSVQRCLWLPVHSQDNHILCCGHVTVAALLPLSWIPSAHPLDQCCYHLAIGIRREHPPCLIQIETRICCARHQHLMICEVHRLSWAFWCMLPFAPEQIGDPKSGTSVGDEVPSKYRSPIAFQTWTKQYLICSFPNCFAIYYSLVLVLFSSLHSYEVPCLLGERTAN